MTVDQRLMSLRFKVVESFPFTLEEGVFYFLPTEQSAMSLCANGCGLEMGPTILEDGALDLTDLYTDSTLTSPTPDDFCGAIYLIRGEHIYWIDKTPPSRRCRGNKRTYWPEVVGLLDRGDTE